MPAAPLRALSLLALPLAVCGIEAAWGSQAAALITGLPEKGAGALPWGWSAGLLVASAVATRLLLRLPWPLSIVRWLAVLTAAAALLVLVRTWYYGGEAAGFDWVQDLLHQASQVFLGAPRLGLTLLVGAALWHRGTAIARSELEGDDVYNHFFTGIGALSVIALAEGLLPDGRMGITPVIVLFVFGLGAMALARLAAVQNTAPDPAAAPGLTRHWASVAGIAIGAILSAALLGAALFSFDLTAVVLSWASILTTYLFYALVLISLPFLWLAEWAVYGLRLLLASLGVVPRPPEPPQPPEAQDIDDRQRQLGSLPPEVLTALKLSIIGVLAVIVLVVLLRAVFRPLEKEKTAEDEIHESLWSWQLARATVLAALRALWRRWFGRPPAEAAPGAYAGEEGAAATTARSVREIYRRFLHWAAARGLHRAPSQTPYEFLEQVGRRHPAAARSAGTLTEAYVAARYSATTPDAASLRVATEAWEALQEDTRHEV